MPVLLRAMGRYELLLQPIAAHQGGVSPTGEDEAIVGPQQELARDLAQCAKPADQVMLQCAGSGRCLAGSRQMPAKEFASMPVNSRDLAGPAFTARPDPTQVARTAFVRGGRH
jgi:hypothetical protein